MRWIRTGRPRQAPESPPQLPPEDERESLLREERELFYAALDPSRVLEILPRFEPARHRLRLLDDGEIAGVAHVAGATDEYDRDAQLGVGPLGSLDDGCGREVAAHGVDRDRQHGDQSTSTA